MIKDLLNYRIIDVCTGNNHSIEDKSTNQERDTTGKQHPSMYMSIIATHVKVVQRV